MPEILLRPFNTSFTFSLGLHAYVFLVGEVRTQVSYFVFIAFLSQQRIKYITCMNDPQSIAQILLPRI